MSSLYSDPPFARGGVLLGFDAKATLDGSSNPIEGSDTVGEVKVFQDIDPVTGTKKSNQLVYCVAVRAKQASVANGDQATNLTPKSVVKFEAGTFTNVDGLATNAAGQVIGVVDEYLPKAPNVNDIFWVVVKGPTTAKFTTTAVSTGDVLAVSATAGSLAAAATPTLGQHWLGFAVGAKAGATLEGRVMLTQSILV